MKKLIIFIATFISGVSIAQQENNIINKVTKELDHARSQLGFYIFEDHKDLDLAGAVNMLYYP